MNIDVRLFAMLRERAGSDTVTVEVPDNGATVRDALEAVSNAPGLADVMARVSVVMAVNREYADDDSPLAEGDELALIPPVSGGATAGATEAFESSEGYDQFMELVGRHAPEPPKYVELLGMRPLLTEPGHMRWEFQATELMLNPAGLVQGGFVTAMLDESMGCAAIAQLGPGRTIPTLELKVSFLKPTRPGRLVCDGHVVQMGKSVAFLEAELRDDDGNLVATATATARVVTLGDGK
ncbi:MAG TPA: molybdopterin converting factor subunit 1 [Solirubrobacterales bacterium]|nr:molybdopterin converting factor subunit 1 [Solirubrobacterales bacterium]